MMISVIVPVYNIEAYIEKCILSITGQSYKNLEIIIVDDGSTDASGSICDKYAVLDSRITVIHKANGGLSEARNCALDIAKGDYISFVDGDDRIHPQMYEILLKCIEHHKADMICCEYSSDENDLKRQYEVALPTMKLKTGTEAIIDLAGVYAMAWNKLYRKAIFDDIRYPKNKLHEDEYVIHEVLYKANLVGIIDLPLYFYSVREDSIISKVNEDRIFDAIGAFESRIRFAKDNDWKEVIPASVVQYCDYCMRWYKLINDGLYPQIDRELAKRLWKMERKAVADNKMMGLGKSHRLFACSPFLYDMWGRLVNGNRRGKK